MNIQKMVSDLNRLCVEWERHCCSSDALGQKEWMRGVLHGIRLTLRLVRSHVVAPPTLRGNSKTPY